MAINRSFTVPSKLATTSRTAPTAEIGAAEGIETLYVHPNANIIKFTTPGPGSRPSSSGAGSGSPRQSDPQSSGTLPWTSYTERKIATGPLEIYRVPGSVSFLHSGSLLHAIMPRSQCWCVDGVNKFALRVPLPNTYYRIELPGETPEDVEKVEELKVTLQKVLFYERTPCPFARGFSVELPEEPKERKERIERRKSLGPAKRWTLDRAYSWKPEGEQELQSTRRGSEDNSGGSGSATSSDDEVAAGADQSEEQSQDSVKELATSTTPSRPPAGLSAMRSITAPPQLTLRSTPPSRIRAMVALDGMLEVSEPVATPSSARLNPARIRTFQQIPTDMPPSPPDSSAGIELAETPARVERAGREEQESTREEDAAKDGAAGGLDFPGDAELTAPPAADNDLSDHATEQTYRGKEPGGLDTRHPASRPIPSTVDADPRRGLASDRPQKEQPRPTPKQVDRQATPTPPPASSPEDPFAAIQARILARRSIGGGTPTTSLQSTRRTSPSRTSSSSHSSSSTATRRSADSTQRQQAFATALVRKACTVFLGPPAHLVAIMLKIAARFANGAFGSGFVVESPAGSKHVPGSFNLESVDADELEGEEEEEVWEEDDFGVPLRSPIRLAAVGVRERERRGWEVD